MKEDPEGHAKKIRSWAELSVIASLLGRAKHGGGLLIILVSGCTVESTGQRYHSGA